MENKYLVAIAVSGKIDVADVEGGHHVVVLVNQVVAVEHVHTGPGSVVRNDLLRDYVLKSSPYRPKARLSVLTSTCSFSPR